MEKLILECAVRSVLIAVCTALALYVLRVRRRGCGMRLGERCGTDAGSSALDCVGA